MEDRRWGGARAGAGKPHEHQEYVLVEVVDFYGDKDTLVVGLYLKRDGTPNKATERRAEDIAAHHVGEQAQSVRILKRLCCSIGDSVELKVVKAMTETGIYALALNGTCAWINQDDEQSEPYGQITGSYSNKAKETLQQAIEVYKTDKEQAAKMLEPYFEAVTRKFQ